MPHICARILASYYRLNYRTEIEYIMTIYAAKILDVLYLYFIDNTQAPT